MGNILLPSANSLQKEVEFSSSPSSLSPQTVYRRMLNFLPPPSRGMGVKMKMTNRAIMGMVRIVLIILRPLPHHAGVAAAGVMMERLELGCETRNRPHSSEPRWLEKVVHSSNAGRFQGRIPEKYFPLRIFSEKGIFSQPFSKTQLFGEKKCTSVPDRDQPGLLVGRNFWFWPESFFFSF